MGKDASESLPLGTFETGDATCPSLRGGVIGPEEYHWVWWSILEWQLFPGSNRGRETNDNTSILEKIDGNEARIALREVSNGATGNRLRPLDDPPVLESKRQSSSPGKACILPTFVIGLQFDEMGNGGGPVVSDGVTETVVTKSSSLRMSTEMKVQDRLSQMVLATFELKKRKRDESVA